MNLETAIKLFLGEHKPTTADAYRSILKRFCAYTGPEKPIHLIKSSDMLEYAQETIYPAGYKPSTTQKHIKTLKAFFNWLEKNQLNTAPNPSRILRVKSLPREHSRDKAMTDDELTAILNYLKYKPRDYALLLFLADTGARRGGAATLKVEDLDIPNRRAVVTEKGDKTRPVFFGDQTAQALEKWLQMRKPYAGKFVFRKDGRPLLPDSITRLLYRACDTVGIRRLGAHSLRHRKGHQFADNRVAPSIAATALGHSDVKVTLDHYYPTDYETAERELRKLMIKSDETPSKITHFPRKTTG